VGYALIDVWLKMSNPITNCFFLPPDTHSFRDQHRGRASLSTQAVTRRREDSVKSEIKLLSLPQYRTSQDLLEGAEGDVASGMTDAAFLGLLTVNCYSIILHCTRNNPVLVQCLCEGHIAQGQNTAADQLVG